MIIFCVNFQLLILYCLEVTILNGCMLFLGVSSVILTAHIRRLSLLTYTCTCTVFECRHDLLLCIKTSCSHPTRMKSHIKNSMQCIDLLYSWLLLLGS